MVKSNNFLKLLKHCCGLRIVALRIERISRIADFAADCGLSLCASSGLVGLRVCFGRRTEEMMWWLDVKKLV